MWAKYLESRKGATGGIDCAVKADPDETLPPEWAFRGDMLAGRCGENSGALTLNAQFLCGWALPGVA